MDKDNQTVALALFSGGLDSILACRVITGQNIRVIALKFVTPFFDYELLEDREGYRRRIFEKYGIEVEVLDISAAYLEMLAAPPHGYGKHFNPCVDCKIMMIREAKSLMARYGASFIITGEVVGQRPMSQRKDTLRIIERDSETDAILLRPLCARSQKPTRVEEEGIVDRERLPNFSGRGRTDQMELAAQFGISDYPSPAGGCLLTDPILSRRIRRLYEEQGPVSIDNIRFLMVGRQFRLPGGGWLAMGRRQGENRQVLERRRPGDLVLKLVDRPGPTALLRYPGGEEDILLAAALVARYGKKVSGKGDEAEVKVQDDHGESLKTVLPLADEEFSSWLI